MWWSRIAVILSFQHIMAGGQTLLETSSQLAHQSHEVKEAQARDTVSCLGNYNYLNYDKQIIQVGTCNYRTIKLQGDD